jgi:hypothetical protein
MNASYVLYAKLLSCAVAAGLAITTSLPASGGEVIVDPPANDFTLQEGEVVEETVTVTIPGESAFAMVDVYLLADTTGSMWDPIAAVRAGAADIVDGLKAELSEVNLAFGVGEFKDFPYDPYAFKSWQGVTEDSDAAKAAISSWLASGGADGPEGQFYAYDQIAENRAPSNDGSAAGIIGWRAGAKKILLVFGDAPAHVPVCSAVTYSVNGHGVDYDITESSVIAKLQSAGITFIGISTLTGYPVGMDSSGSMSDYYSYCGTSGPTPTEQATRIAAATGGEHLIGISSSAIVDVIKALVTTAATTINNVALVPTGDTAAFVSAVTPASGYGPLVLDEEHVITFDVQWTGNVPCADEDQIFTGSLDVVADGAVIASKPVTITVVGCPIGPIQIPVPFDIRPTSCPNPLTVNERGVLPTAILGTAHFDVTTIDVSTVRLAGVAPATFAFEDVATPYEPYLGKDHAMACNTLGPDGYLDLTLKFDAQSIIAVLGPVSNGDVLVLPVTGNLLDGTPFAGEDVVRMIVPRAGGRP